MCGDQRQRTVESVTAQHHDSVDDTSKGVPMANIDVDAAKADTQAKVEAAAKADRLDVIRNKIATARARGDVAGHEALRNGMPSRGAVENAVLAWQEVMTICEREAAQ